VSFCVQRLGTLGRSASEPIEYLFLMPILLTLRCEMKLTFRTTCVSLVSLLCLYWSAAAKPIREDPTPKKSVEADVKAEWTMDVNSMKFPKGPASGKVTGNEFKLEWAKYNGETLNIKEVGGRTQFIIFLFLAKGETLDGKIFTIAPDMQNNKNPHIHIHARTKAWALPNNYAMRLEFGPTKDGKTTGKIYLCLPGEDKTYIAGTIEVAPQ